MFGNAPNRTKALTSRTFSCPWPYPREETSKTMNEDEERIKKHHGGPGNTGEHFNRPYWKRAHKSPFFWVAAVFILVAMVIFITTDGFLLRPAPAATTVR